MTTTKGEERRVECKRASSQRSGDGGVNERGKGYQGDRQTHGRVLILRPSHPSPVPSGSQPKGTGERTLRRNTEMERKEAVTRRNVATRAPDGWNVYEERVKIRCVDCQPFALHSFFTSSPPRLHPSFFSFRFLHPWTSPCPVEPDRTKPGQNRAGPAVGWFQRIAREHAGER